MESLTVFFTVLSGVITFVVGQLAVKLILDPVQDLKKTIGQISHTLVDRANVIANPDVSTKEEKNETSVLLRKLSAHLHAHLYLVPWYVTTCRIFRIPSKEKLLSASKNLIGLSNGIYSANPTKADEWNAKRIEAICDSLSIYLADESRWPKDLK
ncbi:MAG: hypothetical protein E8D40_13500 [Nitrospira sp.]|nr:MAG: hypothetical protein E8D40_13500 [Nitrospira sp.]